MPLAFSNLNEQCVMNNDAFPRHFFRNGTYQVQYVPSSNNTIDISAYKGLFALQACFLQSPFDFADMFPKRNTQLVKQKVGIHFLGSGLSGISLVSVEKQAK